MKVLKLSLIVAAVAFLSYGTSYAFHSGGVAECVGCHNMHEPAGEYLLIGTDQSSTCLSCHENAADTGPSSYHISTAEASLGAGLAPKQRTPGGDFGWLKKSYTMTIRGTTSTEAGETHGHNIVAADKNYVEDATNTTAPGGSYPANKLACISCHDMHGKYRRLNGGAIATTGAPIIGSGSYATSLDPAAGEAVGVYRLLGGIGYTNSLIAAAGVSFAVNPPAAVAPSSYNRTESSTYTRVAYGKGMSRWCATCHPDMHTDSGGLKHSVDENLGSTIANNYNTYVKSGDATGSSASSYSSLVPFETNSTDYTALKAIVTSTPNAGPASSNQVMCLSCHRAHASGFMEMTRWNNEGEFMTYTSLWPGTDTTPSVPQFARGRLGAETLAAYNDIPASKFASYQRVYCNKCHVRD